MICTATSGFIIWFLGGHDYLLTALFVLVFVDFFTGWMKAIIKKELSSNIGWRGSAKKVMTFVLVGMSHMIGYYVINDGGIIRSIVIVFYISNEGLSILENASAMGVNLPNKLKNLLLQLNQDGKERD